MNWLSRLFGGQPSSAQVAKDRLKVVLKYDRAHMNPEMLERIKNDILDAISAHIEIDRAGVQITSERDHLVADIPLKRKYAESGYGEEPLTPAPAASYSRRDYPAKKKRRR